MKRLWHGVVASLVAVGCAGQPLPAHRLPPATGAAPSMAGQLIVKFQPKAAEAVEQARRTGTLSRTGLASIDRLFHVFKVVRLERVFPAADGSSLARVYLLYLTAPQRIEIAARAFSEDPLIEYAEPNSIATLHSGIDTPPAAE